MDMEISQWDLKTENMLLKAELAEVKLYVKKIEEDVNHYASEFNTVSEFYDKQYSEDLKSIIYRCSQVEKLRGKNDELEDEVKMLKDQITMLKDKNNTLEKRLCDSRKIEESYERMGRNFEEIMEAYELDEEQAIVNRDIVVIMLRDQLDKYRDKCRRKHTDKNKAQEKINSLISEKDSLLRDLEQARVNDVEMRKEILYLKYELGNKSSQNYREPKEEYETAEKSNLKDKQASSLTDKEMAEAILETHHFNAKITQLLAENAKLKASVIDLERKHSHCQYHHIDRSELHQKDTEYKQLMTEKNDILDKFVKLQETNINSVIESTVAIQNSTILKLQEDKKIVIRDNNRLLDRLREAEDCKRLLEEENEHLKNIYDRLQSEKHQEIEHRGRLLKQVTELQISESSLKELNIFFQTQNQALKNETYSHLTLKAQVQQLQESESCLKDKLKRAEESKEKLESEISFLLEKRDNLENEINQLQNFTNNLCVENMQLKSENERFRRERLNTKKENYELKKQVNELQETEAVLREENSSLSLANERLQSESFKVFAEKEELSDKLQAVIRERDNLQMENQRLSQNEVMSNCMESDVNNRKPKRSQNIRDRFVCTWNSLTSRGKK